MSGGKGGGYGAEQGGKAAGGKGKAGSALLDPRGLSANDEDDLDDEDEESGSTGSDSGGYLEGEPDEQEKQHFLDVCWSLMDYPKDAAYDIDRLQMQIKSLDPHEAKLWPVDGSDAPRSMINEIKVRVAANAKFLGQMPCPDVCAMELGLNGQSLVTQVPGSHHVASRNSSKVRSTLRQFVRDWAAEGEAERQTSYWPLINALVKHKPPPQKLGKGKRSGRSIHVLCPGCGLGRLPFDLVRLGYAAQGNEFSYHMLLGSHLVLNRSPRINCHVVFPFVLGTTNRKGKNDHLASIRIPDVCPSAALGEDAELSMAAGEFVQVYQGQTAQWDAVLSAFFLDTAKNIFIYIRTIADILRPGGLLINLGPLLYHYAEMPHEISIELSWEEVKPALEKYFEIIEEDSQVAQYTTNPDSMMGVKYRCMFFVAVRNSVPVSGVSNPVF